MKFKSLTVLFLFVAMGIVISACGSAGGNTSSSSSGNDSADASASSADDGKVYEFIVQNHDPASSICAEFLEAWGQEITDASDGRIQFVYYHGGSLGSAVESVDMVLNGNADICWNAASINAGRFPYSEAISLPMLGIETTVDASKVTWSLYENNDYVKDEWKDFYVIEVAAACDVPVATTKKKIEVPSDFSGLRMRATIPALVTWLQTLGSVPMSITIPDTYENLEKNVADGCFNDWHNLKANNLFDVVKYVMDAKVLYSQQCMLMNWDSYNQLPDDLKAIFDAHSGEYAALMAGSYWDRAVTESKADAAAAGSEVYTASAEVQAAMDNAAEISWTGWIDTLNGNGLDGQKAFDDLMSAIDTVLD
jgi:TRAP-type C4-dicarboxylate transport system substrate-binding protein